MSESLHTPTWLTAAVDQRLAFFNEKAGHGRPIPGIDVIIMSLTEPPPNATQEDYIRWDHSCDNCGKVCPMDLRCGAVNRIVNGQRAHVTFGCCDECARLP